MRKTGKSCVEEQHSMTVVADISFDTCEVLAEFNRAIRSAIISLGSLTRREGFDPEELTRLAVYPQSSVGYRFVSDFGTWCG
jgi:hypothetical protein